MNIWEIVLQRAFADHHVDKVIPVERLIKCRFQENLVRLNCVMNRHEGILTMG